MSPLRPTAVIGAGSSARLLLTLSGHSVDYKVQQVCTENQEFPYRRSGHGRTEAELLFKRSLAIFEKALGPEHPHVGKALHYLAELYHAQDKHAEAEPLYKRALAIRDKALGPEHPDVAQSLESYAALLHKTGRSREAIMMELRAKAIRTKHARQNPAN